MNIQHALLIFTIGLILPSKGYSQDVSLMTRGNFGIGASYQNLDYNGSNVPFSPGGGIGLEAGIQLDLWRQLIIQPTIGFQYHLALQAESINGVSNQTSVNFGRAHISLGIGHHFELSDGIFTGILIGMGSQYHFPGKLSRIENDNDLGESEYDPRIGFYAEIGMRLQFFETVCLNPTIRYRRLQFSAIAYSEGPVTDLPTDLQLLNANGVELGLTIVKRLRSKL